MEELIYTTQDKFSSFSATWAAWFEYRASQWYQELIRDNI